MQLAMNAPAVVPNEPGEALKSLDAVAKDQLAKNGDSKSAEATIAAAAPATGSSFADEAKVESFAEVAQAPAAAKTAAPAMAAQSFTQGGKLAANNLRQRFSQNAPAGMAVREEARMKQRPNILNNFDVQQEGNRIRVVDEDGSTYTGKLEQIAQSDSRSLSQKKEQNIAARAAAAPKRGEETESNEYFFRAEGVNASLKKKVVFEANYLAAPANNEQNAATRRLQTEEQNPARIVGKVQVAGEPPVEVDAVSVSR
jgi:hypothetical protein